MTAKAASQLQFQEGSLNDGRGQLALADDFVNLDRGRAQRLEHPAPGGGQHGFVQRHREFLF